MKAENRVPIVFLVIIAERKTKSDFLSMVSDLGGQIINIVYGRGSVKASALADVFGFTADEDKAIITCLIPKQMSDTALEILTKRFHFDRPNTGVAFTVPVEGLVY